MTSEELSQHLSAYAAGLDAELTLLRQIDRLSDTSDGAYSIEELNRVNDAIDQRERLVAALVRIEHEIRPLRHLLADARDLAVHLPGFDDVAALHRTAAALVSHILTSDWKTSDALRQAEEARRTASQALDAAETTLEAYRRVVSPPLNTPALVNRHG